MDRPSFFILVQRIRILAVTSTPSTCCLSKVRKTNCYLFEEMVVLLEIVHACCLRRKKCNWLEELVVLL